MKGKYGCLTFTAIVLGVVVWNAATQISFRLQKSSWEQKFNSIETGYSELASSFLELTNSFSQSNTPLISTDNLSTPVLIVQVDSLSRYINGKDNNHASFQYRTIPRSERADYSLTWWAPLLKSRQPRVFAGKYPPPDSIRTVVLVELSEGIYVGDYTIGGGPALHGWRTVKAYTAAATARVFDVANKKLLAQHTVSADPDKEYSYSTVGKIVPYDKAYYKVVDWVQGEVVSSEVADK